MNPARPQLGDFSFPTATLKARLKAKLRAKPKAKLKANVKAMLKTKRVVFCFDITVLHCFGLLYVALPCIVLPCVALY